MKCMHVTHENTLQAEEYGTFVVVFVSIDKAHQLESSN